AFAVAAEDDHIVPEGEELRGEAALVGEVDEVRDLRALARAVEAGEGDEQRALASRGLRAGRCEPRAESFERRIGPGWLWAWHLFRNSRSGNCHHEPQARELLLATTGRKQVPRLAARDDNLLIRTAFVSHPHPCGRVGPQDATHATRRIGNLDAAAVKRRSILFRLRRRAL